MSFRVEDNDLGLKQIEKDLLTLGEYEIKIGLQSGDTLDDGTPLAAIGAWNEYGTSDIPSRPFMRSTSDTYKDKWANAQGKLLNRVIDGLAPIMAARTLGEMIQGDIQRHIRKGNWVMNAPSTVKRKKSNKPLIDTGHMRQSIRYKVTRGGED